jgi:hypothetical protein
MTQNKLYKSKEEAFINNDTYYNYGGWAPNSLFLESAITQNNLLYHYDFSSAANMVLRNSGGVNYIETIYDLSPNSFDLTQPNTSKQPIFTQDAFGNFCGVFDGIDDDMFISTIGVIPAQTGYTFFSVFETTEYTGFTTFITGGSPSQQPLGINDNKEWEMITNQSYIPFSATTGFSDNFLNYYSADINTSVEGQINGVDWITRSGFLGSSVNYIGFGSLLGSLFSEVKCKEYLLYNTILPEWRIQQIVAYLKNKWAYSAW